MKVGSLVCKYQDNGLEDLLVFFITYLNLREVPVNNSSVREKFFDWHK